MLRIPVCITEPKYRIGRTTAQPQSVLCTGFEKPFFLENLIKYVCNTQMFRAHLKAHTSLLAFSLTGETPTHE